MSLTLTLTPEVLYLSADHLRKLHIKFVRILKIYLSVDNKPFGQNKPHFEN